MVRPFSFSIFNTIITFICYLNAEVKIITFTTLEDLSTTRLMTINGTRYISTRKKTPELVVNLHTSYVTTTHNAITILL